MIGKIVMAASFLCALSSAEHWVDPGEALDARMVRELPFPPVPRKVVVKSFQARRVESTRASVTSVPRKIVPLTIPTLRYPEVPTTLLLKAGSPPVSLRIVEEPRLPDVSTLFKPLPQIEPVKTPAPIPMGVSTKGATVSPPLSGGATKGPSGGGGANTTGGDNQASGGGGKEGVRKVGPRGRGEGMAEAVESCVALPAPTARRSGNGIKVCWTSEERSCEK